MAADSKECTAVDEPETKKAREENPPTVMKNPGETQPNPMSKNQIKKLKKLEEYQRNKKERRLKERERQKQKRQEALASGQSVQQGPSRKELKKRQALADDNAKALCVAIDLDYDELMSERDVAKCVKQCLRIYTINRRSASPGRLHLTGIKTEGRIHAALKKNDGWENWHLDYHFDETHLKAFNQEQMIYLTCESDTVLYRLDENHVYVIGGLVDHNHQKGLCHERATQAGLNTARLPLSEHVDMKTRSVLSTFHVFEILIRVAEGKSWTDAILETLPMRKGAKPKETNEVHSTNAVEEEQTHHKGVEYKQLDEKSSEESLKS